VIGQLLRSLKRLMHEHRLVVALLIRLTRFIQALGTSDQLDITSTR